LRGLNPAYQKFEFRKAAISQKTGKKVCPGKYFSAKNRIRKPSAISDWTRAAVVAKKIYWQFFSIP
jgi:hypothetical protein